MSVEKKPGVEPKNRKTSHIQRLFEAIYSLWNAQEVLRLSSIRRDYLHYFFAFPLALTFINIQGCLLTGNLRVLGVPSTTVTFISFAVGATVMFIIYSVKNIHLVSKISSALTLLGFVPWLFLQEGYPSLICAVIFLAGIGGCMANSGLSFMFVLNNAERFFGCLFMVLFIGLANINSDFIKKHTPVRISLIVILVVGISVCMYKTKPVDFAELDKKVVKRFDPSIWLSLFILLSYFIIRILGFYVPEFHMQLSPLLRNTLLFASVLIGVIILLVLRRSIWTLCNVFFISAILSYVMGFAQALGAAYIFSGIKDIGLFVGFYLLTCVVNKFCDFRLHKIVALICISTIAAVFVVPDMLIRTTLTQPVAVIVSAGLFIIFLLLSPALSQYLFGSDWSRDFTMLHMSEIEAQVALAQTTKLENENLSQSEMSELLTPEEIDVAMLLIEGETQREIARRLHLNAADVNRQLIGIRDKVIRKGDPDPGIAAAIYEFKLTRREADMLRCLCRSMTNVEIAAELHLSEETVKIHVRNLMKKLPVENRQNVASWVQLFREIE